MSSGARLTIEDAAYFFDTHTVVVAQHEGCPFDGAQFFHRFGQANPGLLAHGHAVRARVRRGERFHAVFHVRIGWSGDLRAALARPYYVQRAVDGDAVEPGAETGPLVE